ncbi:MAG: extracellular solute-binding protein [Paenibacillus dendritiformis]|uniref:extracellular solute-binding protein n=1 Tax=Paenibacillus dendritiformis TaxID=130049 RepID=UPI001B2918D4|nr:extracellular solute-binding protein [Paenibacillus dendritiformis]MDU5144292.1 extracellular solute-binding protein [Paenibacillus dendritiformis]GIO73453.1 ABC transporter [Paenibacillus dendritiformis]
MKRKWGKWAALLLAIMMLVSACSGGGSGSKPGKDSGAADGDQGEKPATWIADRTIKGRIFMNGVMNDISDNQIDNEVAQKIKELTGITLEWENTPANSSLEGLTAGLATGDLPDVIVSYLNHSGRPEMPVLLKAAREGMFTDLTPYLKETKIYSKYFEDGYLPVDTKNGVMFRPEFNGSTYFVHMRINREGGQENRKWVGGPHIRKDIAEALNVDPKSITTSEQLHELAKKIKAGNFKDANGKEVYPVGPRYWGGNDNSYIYSDLRWGDEGFFRDSDGAIKHESQTEYPMKRIEFVQKLLNEGLIHPEYYTMDETRATEGALNGSFAIISDMHNYLEFNKDMHYLPLGPLDSVEGPYQMRLTYKSGYNIWAIPATTERPEEIVKFADFLASREGKLLWQYGIEGRDYTLDEKGNPIVKQEVIDLKKQDPKAAQQLAFQGVGDTWGEYLGNTDLDPAADFGEAEYGNAAFPAENEGPNNIADYFGWDEKYKNAKIQDGYGPLSFLGEYEKGTELKTALDYYNESLIRAYYAKSRTEAAKIMESVNKQLEAADLQGYIQLLEKKSKDPATPIVLNPSQ